MLSSISRCSASRTSSRRGLHYTITFASLLVLVACGGGGSDGQVNNGGGDLGGDGSSEPTDPPPTPTLDQQLRHVARDERGLTGDPATPRGLSRTSPNGDPMVKLGQILFFSQTLSAGFDSACASCHHPDFAGSDELSLPVGVAPENAATVGPGRLVDHARDLDPRTDAGPNMPRNSLSIFNAPFYDRAMFYDGRVFVLDDKTVPGGRGQNIRTPESGNTADISDADGLLELAAQFPMITDNEMRGYMYTDLTTPTAYRAHLVARLRGEVDTQYLDSGAGAKWLARFRAAFSNPSGSAEQLITLPNVQQALAAYMASGIFVETPWKDYLHGNSGALSEDAKRGAMLFLQTPAEGGLGCASCHSGDKFSNEKYYNTGFPQIGRGFRRVDGADRGRWGQTRAAKDLYAFRVPSLLNVEQTAPYGHAGTFENMQSVLRYHADPQRQVDLYDFSLQQLKQFLNTGIIYDNAEVHTRTVLGTDSFAASVDMLPRRALSNTEVQQLSAFLAALTDPCVESASCLGRWTPDKRDDPDGHLLVRGGKFEVPDHVDSETPDNYPDAIALDFPGLPPRTTFADVQGCESEPSAAVNTGQALFALRSGDPDFGLNDAHGFNRATWFNAGRGQLEAVMEAGGVSATYLDDDCYPDLVFAGGDASGMRFYRNLAGTAFQDLDNVLTNDPGTRFSGTAVADLNGDYRRELLLSNVHNGEIPIYSPAGGGQYAKVAGLPMARHTFGISFGVLDDSGYPYFFAAHWAGGGSGTQGTSPGLWRSTGTDVRPWDDEAHTSSKYVNQQFNFTPKFADFTGDGRTDLVISSDFNTSVTLRNDAKDGGVVFENTTDKSVITDENGMGSTLLDIDNDGTLEWFVSSILDPSGKAAANWGVTGNRLYKNTSSDGDLTFANITERSGVRDGAWGWGACATDFNNDGFADIAQVNGFGFIPSAVDQDGTKQRYDRLTEEYFQNKPPRLFMNNGDGTFTDRASEWQIDLPSEGRGLVCFDYDRDGDMDIVLLDHSSGLQFFENQSGHGNGRHFLNVRLVGAAPNTDALGARVHVTANLGNGHGEQTMLRLSQANSNFNSQNPPDMHFGLGQATTVAVRVTWPGGGELVCNGVVANQFLVLDQRDGQGACSVP